MSGGNQGLWKELNVNITQTYMFNPCTNIFFFADVPNPIKLIRNWFLDYGFILKDGTLINKALLV